ncbi:MAG: OOP family OmpA-OmpF porin [Cyclobacteriaceae bacterium]|jgi:OOP family OmpA-OmpF porin
MKQIAEVVFATFLVLLISSSTNAQGRFLTVKGKVVNKTDSSALVGVTVLYEKLPYYDDMGMTRTDEDGSYSFHLAENTAYVFRIDGVPGYLTYEEEQVISGETDDTEAVLDLFVSPEEREELIRLDNLNFNRGSATIMSSSFGSLDDFIIYINERPDVMIQLEGHTDFAGNDEANMRLSQARVESIGEYLGKNGVKKSRILTKAFGGTLPLTQERTDEARLLNRRVEVRLIRQ